MKILITFAALLLSLHGWCQGAFVAGTANFGSAVASQSFDSSGNFAWSNSFNGAHGLLGTNGHIYTFDQYGNKWWTQTNGMWYSNANTSITFNLFTTPSNAVLQSVSPISTNSVNIATNRISFMVNGVRVFAASNDSSALFAGGVTATSFNGNGGGLTGLNASQLASGTVPAAQLPGGVNPLTNGFFGGLTNYTTAGTGATNEGAWSSDGASYTNSIACAGGTFAVMAWNTNTAAGNKSVVFQHTIGSAAGTAWGGTFAISAGNVSFNNNGNGVQFAQSAGTIADYQLRGLQFGSSSTTNWFPGLTLFGGIVVATNGFSSFSSNLIAPSSIVFPATTVPWTNTTGRNISVYIDNTGVTGTTTKINGTQVYSSLVGDVRLDLQPGEYFSETYTVGTPAATIKPQ